MFLKVADVYFNGVENLDKGKFEGKFSGQLYGYGGNQTGIYRQAIRVLSFFFVFCTRVLCARMLACCVLLYARVCACCCMREYVRVLVLSLFDSFVYVTCGRVCIRFAVPGWYVRMYACRCVRAFKVVRLRMLRFVSVFGCDYSRLCVCVACAWARARSCMYGFVCACVVGFCMRVCSQFLDARFLCARIYYACRLSSRIFVGRFLCKYIRARPFSPVYVCCMRVRVYCGHVFFLCAYVCTDVYACV